MGDLRAHFISSPIAPMDVPRRHLLPVDSQRVHLGALNGAWQMQRVPAEVRLAGGLGSCGRYWEVT